jgi:hypothetical protein
VSGPTASGEIARPTGRCAATGESIEPGARYVATLVQPEGSEALERLDFGAEVWEAGARPAPSRTLFGFWRATMPEPSAKKRHPLIADDELLDLFEQIGEAADERRTAFRYVLALLLIRKRVLRYEGARTGPEPVILVRPKGVALPPDRGGDGPPLVEVRDPGMDEQATAEATEELSRVMVTDDQTPAGDHG